MTGLISFLSHLVYKEFKKSGCKKSYKNKVKNRDNELEQGCVENGDRNIVNMASNKQISCVAFESQNEQRSTNLAKRGSTVLGLLKETVINLNSRNQKQDVFAKKDLSSVSGLYIVKVVYSRFI